MTLRHEGMCACVCLFLMVGTLAACTPKPPPPIEVGEIVVNPSQTILVGETAALRVEARGGTGLQFKWTALRGKISSTTGPAAQYTAPTSPGPDTVSVTVTGEGNSAVKNVDFNVVGPTTSPTATRSPTAVAKPDATPTQPPTSTHTPSPAQSPTPTLTPTPIPPTSTPTPPLSVVTIDDFEQGVDTWAAYSHKGGEPYSKRAQITDAPQGQYAMSWTVSDITEWAIVETSTTFSIDGCSDLAFWGKGTGKSGFVVELRCPDYENAYTAILSAVPAWVQISLGLPSATSDGDFEKNGNPSLDNCRIAFTNNTNDEYYFDDIRLVGCTSAAQP